LNSSFIRYFFSRHDSSLLYLECKLSVRNTAHHQSFRREGAVCEILIRKKHAGIVPT
jgi:hypothetical protein